MRGLLRFMAGLLMLGMIAVTVTGCEGLSEKVHSHESSEDVDVFVLTEKFYEIGEIYTEKVDYSHMVDVDNSHQLFGLDIPFTEKEAQIIYSGELRCGYNLADIDPVYVGKLVYIDIPDVICLNNITEETVVEKKDGLFNAVSFEDNNIWRDQALAVGRERAVELDLAGKAKTEFCRRITEFYGRCGYTVSFI